MCDEHLPTTLLLCRHIIEYIGCGSFDLSSQAAAKSSMFLVRCAGLPPPPSPILSTLFHPPFLSSFAQGCPPPPLLLSRCPHPSQKVEEFVDGGTLMRIVCRQMESDEEMYRLEDAVRWLIGIARGLKYLHECQPMVIHRDLKLENILLSGEHRRI